MRLTRWAGLIVLSGLAAMTGCEDVKAKNTALTRENEDLRAQIQQKDAALEATNQELRTKSMQLNEFERSSSAAPRSGDVTIGGGGGQQWTIAGDLLFDPGQTTVKAGAKKQLDDVVKALNGKYAMSTVRVVGHTDSDPIKKQKARFKDNYELGLARASSVRDYLASKGVSGSRIQVTSMGDSQPKGDKKSSRRVEIFAEGR